MRLSTLFLLPFRIKDLKRVRKIASVLARHGFNSIASNLSLLPGIRKVFSYFRKDPDIPSIPIERRIRLAMEELGPTFIKLGQMLASRPDLVPLSLIMELKHLQDKVPPFPFEQVREIIERDLGKPLDTIFESFEEIPIAAASIAQVHQAKLRTGEKVVVKVQRPFLDSLISSDLRILTFLAKTLEERVPEIRQFRPVSIVAEFKRSLNREIDFRAEANSMMVYAQNFKDETGLKVPVPYMSLCTKHVLVMENVEGIKVTDIEGLKRLNIDLGQVVERGMRITLRSIFEFGFFHADPHPGNFFIMNDGTIALLDFGMMGTIDQERIDELLTFLVSLVTGDIDMLVNILIDANLMGDETDIRAFRSELLPIIVRYKNVTLQSIDLSSLLNEVIEVVVRHHIVVPTDLILVAKSVGTLEGIGREIYPEFSPLKAIQPYLTELYAKRFTDTDRHTKMALRSVNDLVSLLKDAPHDLRRILRKLRQGELKIILGSLGAEERHQIITNRIDRVIYSVLFSVFFFGSILLLDSESALQNFAGVISLCLTCFFFLGMFVSLMKGNRR